jgi:hypothetical protein
MAALASCPATLDGLDFQSTAGQWPTYSQYLPFDNYFSSVANQTECNNLCSNFDENLLTTPLCPHSGPLGELFIPPYSVTPTPTQTVFTHNCFAGHPVRSNAYGGNFFSGGSCFCAYGWDDALLCQYEVCSEPNPTYLIADPQFDVGISGWTADTMDDGAPYFSDPATLNHHFIGGTDYGMGIAGEQQNNGHTFGRPAAHHPMEVVNGQHYIVKVRVTGSGLATRYPAMYIGTSPKSSNYFSKTLTVAAGTMIGSFVATATGTAYVTLFCTRVDNTAIIPTSVEAYACG